MKYLEIPHTLIRLTLQQLDFSNSVGGVALFITKPVAINDY